MAKHDLVLDIKCQPRWWCELAFWICAALLYLNLIPDAPSDEHWGGRISPMERAAAWLVKHGMIIEISRRQ